MAEIDKKTDLIAVECCSSLNQMKKTLILHMLDKISKKLYQSWISVVIINLI